MTAGLPRYLTLLDDSSLTQILPLATEDEAGREAGEAVADAVAAAEGGPAYNSRWLLAGKEMVAGARAEVVAAHSRIFSRGSLPTQRGFLVAGPRL